MLIRREKGLVGLVPYRYVEVTFCRLVIACDDVRDTRIITNVRGCSSWRTTVNQRTIGLHDAVIKEVRLQEKTAVSVTFCCGKKVMAVEEARPESDGC